MGDNEESGSVSRERRERVPNRKKPNFLDKGPALPPIFYQEVKNAARVRGGPQHKGPFWPDDDRMA